MPLGSAAAHRFCMLARPVASANRRAQMMSDAARAVQDIANVSETNLQHALAAAGLDWIVPDWPAPPNVVAMTTTRGGSNQSVTTSEAEFLSAILPSPPVWLKQVHGASVA